MKNVTCFKCHKKGHFANQCKTQERRDKGAMYISSAMCLSTLMIEFAIGTAAADYFWFNKELLLNFREVQNKLASQEGSTQILGLGHINFEVKHNNVRKKF